MANRTTVKSNIDTLNVPSVSNADLGEMLKDNICDNVVFKEDVAVIQSSTLTSITCDFTGKDRIDLTRNGGSLNITVSGIADGQTVHLLINKTAGQAVTFVGVTDVTPVSADVTALARVLYEIIRKGNYYYARAWVSIGAATTDRPGILETATSSEANGLSVTNKIMTPGVMPLMSTTQKGICEAADTVQIDAGQDLETGSNDPLVVVPSQMLRKLIELYDTINSELNPAVIWNNLTLQSGWSGTIRYYKDPFGNVFIQALNVERTGSDLTGSTGSYVVNGLPSSIDPHVNFYVPTVVVLVGLAKNIFTIVINDTGIIAYPDPYDIPENSVFSFNTTYKV